MEEGRQRKFGSMRARSITLWGRAAAQTRKSAPPGNGRGAQGSTMELLQREQESDQVNKLFFTERFAERLRHETILKAFHDIRAGIQG